MVSVAIILFWLGLCLGSFLNAMVWRMHAKMDWVRGRSQCDNCAHQLAAKDLVPLFSWLSLRGRCRYCRQRLSWQHPAVELATGLVFVASYIWWPGGLHGAGQELLFGSWLLSSVGLMALLVYDFRWMLLPNKILYPTFFVALAGRLGYILFFADNKAHSLWLLALSLVVASGIFFLLFYASSGRWIGYGDVRLGLITGTLLAVPDKAFLMILLGSVMGTLFVLPALARGQKTADSKLPYGPFLIAATFVCLLFGSDIINWYRQLLLP